MTEGVTEQVRLLAGRYQVGALLGRGGMAEVHAGIDARLGRRVAIKLLKPSLANDPAFRTRFRQEAQAAARMAHPTIVRVFDAGEETASDSSGAELQVPFIIMEQVDGKLLKDLVRAGSARPGGSHPDHRGHSHGPRVLAPGRSRAPRHQAGQRHGDLGRPGQGDGLRHRPRDLRFVGHDRPDQRDPRHRPVLLAGAGSRRVRRRPHRPLLDRRRALRTAHRAAAVPRRHGRRGRLPARERGAGGAERDQPRRLACPRTPSCFTPSPRTASSVSRRRPSSAHDLEIAGEGKVPDHIPARRRLHLDPVRGQPELDRRIRGHPSPPRRGCRRADPAHPEPTAGGLGLGRYRDHGGSRRRRPVLGLQPRPDQPGGRRHDRRGAERVGAELGGGFGGTHRPRPRTHARSSSPTKMSRPVSSSTPTSTRAAGSLPDNRSRSESRRVGRR